MSSVSRIQLEEWLKTIDVEGDVIDIGGSQNPVEKRTKSWNVSKYQILDFEIPHECKKKPDMICDIQSESHWSEEFDVAFCLEVAEYWHDPMTAFKEINKLLKQEGVLYISFHWLYGLHNPKGEDCLRYTKNAIEKLAKNTGFAIGSIETKEITNRGVLLLEDFYRGEGMRLDFNNHDLFHEGYLCKFRKL